MKEDLDDFWAAVRKCVEAGSSMTVQQFGRASFYAYFLERPRDAPLQYRAPVDETAEYAQGFSYDLALSALLNDAVGEKAWNEVLAEVEQHGAVLAPPKSR